MCRKNERKFTCSKDLLAKLLDGVDCEGDIDAVSSLKRGGDLSLLRLCKTRWTVRFDAVSSLMAQYQSIHSAMCKIEIVSSSDARTNAAGYKRLLDDPELIVALVVVQFVLSMLKHLTLFLQKTDYNMVSAVDEAKNLIQLLNTKRNDE